MHRGNREDTLGKTSAVVSVSKLPLVVDDTDEHDVDNVRGGPRYLFSLRAVRDRDHETAEHRRSRASVEGTSVASSEWNGTTGRQTDSHQARFRGRLFSRPSKQSAAINGGGRRASTVRMYKRSRDGVPDATRCQTLSPRGMLADKSRFLARFNAKSRTSVEPSARFSLTLAVFKRSNR